LYRTVLRTARDKDSQAESIAKFARSEFERYRSAESALLLTYFKSPWCFCMHCRHRQVDRKNYQLIEHLMRKAKRQLAMVQQKQVTGVKML